MKNRRLRAAIRWFAALTLLVLPLVVQVAHADPGKWWAEFFPNTTLSGSPVLTRYDDRVDFDWGTGAPGAGVPADNFSARWTRTEWFDGGTYRFWTRSDDGLRFWIGDLLVVDSWLDQQGGWATRDLYISAGTHQMRVEYYEHGAAALVTLNWERLTGGQGWQAEYYANQNLSGAPALRRTDSAIDFDWGYGSPDGAIPADHFSVRWTHTVGFTAGTYRFLTSTDDGVRLWVDDQLLVDAWYNLKLPNTHWGDIALAEGLHQIRVEYFENGGEAHAHAWWDQVGAGFSGWKGDYYDNRELTGGPALIRDDAEINFDWGAGPPVSWMPDDNFSVRWTRQIEFAAGYYRFSVRSDDGVRVWLDDGLVIDKWQAMDRELHYVDGIYLTGAHRLKVEYFEQNGGASIQFWIGPAEGAGPSQPASPEVVMVEDTDPGFVSGGSPTGWHTAAGGHGGQMTWTRNNERLRAQYNWARWYPSLAPGRYEVRVFVPAQYATTTQARYWIRHAGFYTLRIVDQSAYSGEWMSLGTYDFDGTAEEYVSLSDITYEPYLSRTIAFDAVRWVPRRENPTAGYLVP